MSLTPVANGKTFNQKSLILYFATGVVDIAGVADIGGKFASPVIDIDGAP